MFMDNGKGIDCGLQGWAEWRGAKREKWDNCNRINKKKRKNMIAIKIIDLSNYIKINTVEHQKTAIKKLRLSVKITE